jgi:hypothetical protein
MGFADTNRSTTFALPFGENEAKTDGFSHSSLKEQQVID